MTDPASDCISLIAFACSPREGGNSDLLLEAAIEGALEGGALVERFDLRDMTIAHCRHCGGCAEGNGRCVIEDDMQRLYSPLRRCDRLIIASPVFFMSLTAQAKTMIDRCQPLWVCRNLGQDVSEASHRRASLYLGVGGADFEHLFDGSRSVLAAWLWTLQIFQRTELVFRGVDARGAIREHPGAIEAAREAGRTIAMSDLAEE